MKSKLTKYAVIGVIVIGISVAITFLGGSPEGAKVVWAEVADKIQHTNTVMYKGKITSTIEELDRTTTSGFTNYYSSKYGNRVDSRDSIHCFSYTDLTKITLVPRMKTCHRLKYTAEEFKKEIERIHPRSMVTRILEGEYEEIGESVIDGIAVVGIEFTPSPREIEQGTGRLWIEVGTNLPVYLEMEGINTMGGRSPVGFPTKKILYDFQWNVDLDEDLFSVEIPSDYTIQDIKIDQDK